MDRLAGRYHQHHDRQLNGYSLQLHRQAPGHHTLFIPSVALFQKTRYTASDTPVDNSSQPNTLFPLNAYPFVREAHCTMAYPYSSGDHSTYPYTTAAYPTTAIPQYTQTQIYDYYQQYHCYPPQPYQTIPDPYPQIVAPSYSASMTSATTQGYYGENTRVAAPLDVNRLAPHHSERRSPVLERRSRSTSRTRTWQCDIPSCTSTAQFTRLADLQRHQYTVHGNGVPAWPCSVPRCNRVGEKGFTRKDHLHEHLRNFHHLDVPKRRPGERSANPMGLPQGY